MKQKSRSFYFFLVISLMMLGIMGYSLSLESFYSKFLPLVIGFLIFIFAIVGLRNEWVKGDVGEEDEMGNSNADKGDDKEFLKGYFVGGGCILGFTLAIYLIGFLITIPLFILIYLKVSKTGWVVTVLYALIITAIIYSVFEVGLDIVLYRGVLFDLIA